jgi:hypothetical protein
MTSTFLHEDKPVSPDEAVDMDAPFCKCGGRMWLTRVKTQIYATGPESEKTYECKLCGAARTLFAKRAS